VSNVSHKAIYTGYSILESVIVMNKYIQLYTASLSIYSFKAILFIFYTANVRKEEMV